MKRRPAVWHLKSRRRACSTCQSRQGLQSGTGLRGPVIGSDSLILLPPHLKEESLSVFVLPLTKPKAKLELIVERFFFFKCTKLEYDVLGVFLCDLAKGRVAW